jgi:hypothetical protein
LIPGTFWKLRSSGKFDTPCERMQRAKFSTSCWAWAWFGLVWPPELDELDELGELEPHAAIAVAAAIAAAVRTVGRRLGGDGHRIRVTGTSTARSRTWGCERSPWSPFGVAGGAESSGRCQGWCANLRSS